jgi:hypothetical protein
MTDIGDWPEMVHVKNHYVMVPLNAYQIGNLLDALTQSVDSGDWWHELQDIMAVAMRVAEYKQVTSNNGKVFPYEIVRHRAIMNVETAK